MLNVCSMVQKTGRAIKEYTKEREPAEYSTSKVIERTEWYAELIFTTLAA